MAGHRQRIQREKRSLRAIRLWLALVALLVGSLAACADKTSADADRPQADASGDTTVSGPYQPLYRGEIAGATARYDLEATDWHALPFPGDDRRGDDGTVDLSGFPPIRGGKIADLLSSYLDVAGQIKFDGWSVQPTIYVQFDQPIDTKRLIDPLQTAEKQGDYFLINLSTGAEYGKLVPVRSSVSPAKRGQHLVENLLMAQPVWGAPLQEGHTYAFVVRRSLRDASGKILGQPAVLRQILDVWRGQSTAEQLSPRQAKLAQSLEPLRQAIENGAVQTAWDDLAAATVLTVGHPTAELRTAAQWVQEKWQPKQAINWQNTLKGKDYWLLEATYEAPNFQQGACPYDAKGSGGLMWNPDGSLKVDHVETMRVSVLLPVNRLIDDNEQTPITLSAHGTGGNFLSYTKGGENKIADYLGPRGLAIASIDQPMHGPRCGVALSDTEIDFKTFNFINLTAGRTGFRQSALDTVALTRMVREGLLDPPAELSPYGKAYHFDPARVSFIGHSQGGLSGALVAAIEPAIKAYVLSGAGAGLSLTIMQRKDPLDIAGMVNNLLGLDEGELSEYHPVISLVQLMADTTDPLAYGQRIMQREPGMFLPHVLLTEGKLDSMTPADTAEALAASIGLDVLAPAMNLSDAMKFRKTKTLSPPVSMNYDVDIGATAVLSQWPKLDHFAIFDSAKVAGLYANFLFSAAAKVDAVADFAP